jgi:DNA-binding CsgD family transcriptional regulator
MTMVAFFTKREKKEVFRNAMAYLAASFAYLTVNFLQFYKEYFFMSPKMNILLMLLLDMSMATLVYLWIRFSREIVSPSNIFNQSVIVVFLGSVYVLGWLVIYLFFTDADYYISAMLAKRLAVFLDAVFYCGVLIYILFGLIKLRKNQILSSNKIYLTVISGMLLLYLGWFFINDITLIYFAYGAELWDIYLYDPVILFYILVNIATMIFYHNRNEAFDLNEKPGDTSQNHIDNEFCQPIFTSELAKQYELTKREEEIISWVYWGLSNPEISARLFISTATVKRHMQNIFRKMNIKHRSELIHIIKSQ